MDPLWARSVERLGWQFHYVYFGLLGRKETWLLLKMRNFRFKGWIFFFVCNLWSWSKSCIDEELVPLINFFDWLGSRWVLVSFFCISSSFLFFPLGVSCILPVCFGLVFRCPFILIYKFFCAFTYPKKKKKQFKVLTKCFWSWLVWKTIIFLCVLACNVCILFLSLFALSIFSG